MQICEVAFNCYNLCNTYSLFVKFGKCFGVVRAAQLPDKDLTFLETSKNDKELSKMLNEKMVNFEKCDIFLNFDFTCENKFWPNFLFLDLFCYRFLLFLTTF